MRTLMQFRLKMADGSVGFDRRFRNLSELVNATCNGPAADLWSEADRAKWARETLERGARNIVGSSFADRVA